MRKAGIRVLAGIDVKPTLKRIYEINNPGSLFIPRDICDVTGHEIKEIYDRNGGPRILAGCAPCTPFSGLNGSKGKAHKDYSLLNEFARLILEVRPDGVIMENIPALAREGKEVLSHFVKAVKKAGLAEVHEPILDASWYGVPQRRKRLTLLASKKCPQLPSPTHGPGTLHEYATVRTAIGNLPSIRAGYIDTGRMNHSCRSLSKLNLSRLKATPIDGGSRTDLPKEFWLKTHKKHSGHEDVYGRMRWNKPAPTLTCKCLSISNGRFAHPEQDRGLSIREAAILQGFPVWYRFPQEFDEAQRCIGNAVPPPLARRLSECLLKSLEVDVLSPEHSLS